MGSWDNELRKSELYRIRLCDKLISWAKLNLLQQDCHLSPSGFFLFLHNKEGIIIIMLNFFFHLQLGTWLPRIKMTFPSPTLSWEWSWDSVLANGIGLSPILLTRCRLGGWSARGHPGPRGSKLSEKKKRGLGPYTEEHLSSACTLNVNVWKKPLASS